MEYQFKVVNFRCEATTSDVRRGAHWEIVRVQLEEMLTKYSSSGYELVGQYNFDMEIKAGCYDAIRNLFGKSTSEGVYRIQQLVFRKPR